MSNIRTWHPSTDGQQINKVFKRVDETLAELGLETERKQAGEVHWNVLTHMTNRAKPPVHTVTEDFDGEVHDTAEALAFAVLSETPDMPEYIVELAHKVRGDTKRESTDGGASYDPNEDRTWFFAPGKEAFSVPGDQR